MSTHIAVGGTNVAKVGVGMSGLTFGAPDQPPASTPPVTNSHEPSHDCSCTKAQMPMVILVMGCICGFLAGLIAVMNLMAFKDGVPGVILSVYILIFSTLGLMAEFRMVKFLRGLIYHVMKFVYILTNYYVRAIFYIFLGTLILDYGPLQLICGCCTMALGVSIGVIHFMVKLPIYEDYQEVQAAEADRIEREMRGMNSRFRSGAYTAPYESATVPAAKPFPSLDGRGEDIPPSFESHAVQYEPVPEIEVPLAKKKDDDDLESAYYGKQDKDTVISNVYEDEDSFRPTPAHQASNTSNTRNQYESAFRTDDPFERNDSTYVPPKF
eukprot:Tbor_TRINITY_DN1824_c0_g1::TRINITY_DN1824_c0_g1_i1::g.23067::m.23067